MNYYSLKTGVPFPGQGVAISCGAATNRKCIPTARAPCLNAKRPTPGRRATQKKKDERSRLIPLRRSDLRFTPACSSTGDLPESSNITNPNLYDTRKDDLPSGSDGNSELSRLQAAASTLRSSLPFITRNDLAPMVEYSSTACSVIGSENYKQTMTQWEKDVPEKLEEFKYEIMHFMQPDPQSIVIRWKASWIFVPGLKSVKQQLDQLNQDLENEANQPQEGVLLDYDAVNNSPLLQAQLQNANNLSVQRCLEAQASAATELELARTILTSKHEDDPQTLAALALVNSSLRSLESSTAELNNLAALNPAANKMEEWLLKVEKEQKVSQRENYTKLQKELEDADNSGEIYGSTSIKLDRDGKIYKHVDSFDFEPKFISDPKLREQYMDKIVSSLYLYCQAHRPIDVNQFVWSFKLLKVIAWESLRRNPEIADEVGTLDGKEVDTLMNLMIGLPFLLVGGGIGYTGYFFFVQLPELINQLKHLNDPFY
ncbi:hypothetical protein CYMTET_29141 [Cymbomonas tetramitiformis]|uniref:Uncharacterized protein n=1 Tax=Cymbomonas tetramitiformis TaxID=36881 RepID=A0AAE0FLF1_9CHLO|nr:hypothetical protein CYMTET_29141 [Cymbomonas tetramitiformis]